MRHRDHDAVAAAVRERYHRPAPELGYEVRETPYGVAATMNGASRLILTVDGAAAHDAIAGLARGDGPDSVWVEDRERSRRLAPALADASYVATIATVHLALVGPVRAGVPTGLRLTRTWDVEEFARRKLTYFADGAEPGAGDLGRELVARRAERTVASWYLVEVEGDVVGVLAAYDGEDPSAYLLALRADRRGGGVGSGALAAWVASTAGRAHVINAADGGRPARLYERLGFSDEVYWYQRFERA